MFKRIHSKETRLYLKLLLALPFIIIAVLFLHQGHSIPSLFLPPCLFHTLTGFSCPGCGCTRAVIALLRGDILQSICYNPGILYCAVLYAAFILSHTAAHLSSWIIRLNAKGLAENRSPLRIALRFLLRTWRNFLKDEKKLPSQHQERSFLNLLSHVHGMKTRPIYLYILIYLFLIFGILRFFVELWQRFH